MEEKKRKKEKGYTKETKNGKHSCPIKSAKYASFRQSGAGEMSTDIFIHPPIQQASARIWRITVIVKSRLERD
jgi:hypothetical protein